MPDLNNYIDSLEKAKGNRRAALNNYNAARAQYEMAFAPLGGFPDEQGLRRILALCKDARGFSSSNIFVCVSLLYYYPEALYDGKIPLELAKLMALVLGVTHPSIYIARNKVCAWLNLYPDFFLAVYSVFNELQQRDVG